MRGSGSSPLERVVAIVSKSSFVPTSWEDVDGHVNGVRQEVCGVGRGRHPVEYPFSRGSFVASPRGISYL